MLDVSHNELAALPGLETLSALTALDLSRNWLRARPPELAGLPRLTALNASRNFLRPNAGALPIGNTSLPLGQIRGRGS